MRIFRYAALGVMASSLLAGPVLAEEATSTSTNTNTNTPVVSAVKTIDLACMQTAVEKRDNAIIAALDKHTANVKTALTTRRDALKAALGITDLVQRRLAIKAAWDAFNGTWKKEARLLNDARRAAWRQFRLDAKTCRANGSSGISQDAAGEATDAKL